ncbi:cytochrome c biogenesis protein [Methanohalophilus halophilus]|uniref:Cytochrome C assembly protein n=1 Tax=Methanohalophilus halophilus TaxID=2177 RepID=A0A1L3Q4L4_9EURY|nr:cytochrome c biogenesis protein [Methanohalophilus halophilus]APH39819.1 cytochrome C assembly protein [Methanohalophilus halophilus]RNI07317.1 cytochrome C assembly protein [Methanohalophilus halophilus]SDW85114.1 heme exporter protein C [Methanohalophilus halophilus]
MLVVAFGAIFFYLPVMKDSAGNALDSSFNIFYFHMPIAIVAYLAFFVVFISSILYLRENDQKWDEVSLSAAEVGVIFAFLVLATGSIWAKAIWGWYWVWEPRLTTSLVLFLVYVGYLMLRTALDDPLKRARLSAVFGILAFVSVPLSFLSIRIWRSAHPLMFGGSLYGQGGGGLEGTSLLLVLILNMLAFLMLFVSLTSFKFKNEKFERELDMYKGR